MKEHEWMEARDNFRSEVFELNDVLCKMDYRNIDSSHEVAEKILSAGYQKIPLQGGVTDAEETS